MLFFFILYEENEEDTKVSLFKNFEVLANDIGIAFNVHRVVIVTVMIIFKEKQNEEDDNPYVAKSTQEGRINFIKKSFRSIQGNLK